MPKDLTKENVNIGDVAFQWDVKEYEQYDRNKRWYTTMGIIGVLMVIYAIVVANYSFALIIVLFAIVLYLHEMQDPIEVPVALAEKGVIIGRKFYSFNEIQKFWIIHNPPEVSSVYFGLNSLIKHRLQLPLMGQDPIEVQEFLSQYVTEDTEQEDEPLSDKLSRTFKLH